MLQEALENHILELKRTLERLLVQSPVAYRNATPSSFPETKGVYVISTLSGEILRAGKTGRGNAHLQQRLYKNHLMGDQSGNLPAQLVSSGQCDNQQQAKDWIRRNCDVRFLEINDAVKRSNFEHFLLAVAQPKFCDDNKGIER